jgi:hypothetical protein
MWQTSVQLINYIVYAELKVIVATMPDKLCAVIQMLNQLTANLKAFVKIPGLHLLASVYGMLE